MQYTEGQLGRVFVVRIDNGEDMLISLHKFIDDKDIRAGSILFLGALMNGRMVTVEEPVIPPVPHFVMFEGGWEVFGIGTIYPGEETTHPLSCFSRPFRPCSYGMHQGKSNNISHHRSDNSGIYRPECTARI